MTGDGILTGDLLSIPDHLGLSLIEFIHGLNRSMGTRCFTGNDGLHVVVRRRSRSNVSKTSPPLPSLRDISSAKQWQR